MKREELVNSMRSGLFADRDTLNEAAEYAYGVVDATVKPGDRIYIYTAIGVLLNTIANEIEKMEE